MLAKRWAPHFAPKTLALTVSSFNSLSSLRAHMSPERLLSPYRRPDSGRPCWMAGLCLVVSVLATTSRAAEFRWLDDMKMIVELSADGSVAAGRTADGRPAVWSASGGVEPLSFQGEVDSMSADGNVVVGRNSDLFVPAYNDWEGFVWNRSGDQVTLLDGVKGSTAYVRSLSADGGVMAGGGLSKAPYTSVVWNSEGVITHTLDVPAGYQYATEPRVSSDGSTVFAHLLRNRPDGWTSINVGQWALNTGWTVLNEDAEDLHTNTYLTDNTPDGNAISGTLVHHAFEDDASSSVFIWRRESGWQDLGLPDGSTRTGAGFRGNVQPRMTADASVLVGVGGTSSSVADLHPYIWDDFHGFRDFNEVLLDLDIPGFGGLPAGSTPLAISDDGTVIAGRWQDSSSWAGAAWVVYLDAPLVQPGDTNGDHTVDLADFGTLKDHFGQIGGRKEGDVSGNGRVDLADFGIVKANFGHAGAAVPEPSTFLLAGLAGVGLLALRRRAG